MKKKMLMLVLLVMAIAFQGWAQERTITGTVTSKDDGTPVIGASIMLKGTTKGTVTNVDGKYSIKVAGNEATLVFSFIGMQSQSLLVGTDNVMNVTLAAEKLNVQEVVVTALGIKRERKALGYSMQEVKSKDLTMTNDPNVTTALQGKVAGVQISESGSGVGGSSKILIRGNSSLTDKSEPLWVIDGIPFDNSSNSNTGEYGGLDKGNSTFDLNPDDIESMSVLKGPNAAALYGSRAGNGVIVVTTKKGSKNQKGIGVDFSSSTTISKVAYFLDTQNVYGQGSNGVYDKNSALSWGPKMDGQQLESWTGQTTAYSPQSNRIQDFFRTGASYNNNVSLSGANDKGAFRASLGRSSNDGVFNTENVSKNNFDVNSQYNLSSFLSVDTKISYAETKGKNRPSMGYYSIPYYYYTMPANIRNQDLQPGYTLDPVTGNHVETLYTNPNANTRNPYFLQAQRRNGDDRYRVFGYFAANLKFTDYLKLMVKEGIDFYRERDETVDQFSDNVYASGTPNMTANETFFKEQNTEFLLSFNKHYSDFDVNASFGGNRMQTYTEGLNGSSGKLGIEGYYFLDLGTNKNVSNSYTKKEIQSLYALTSFGYKDFAFLDVTARNDWSSTLPASNRSYFYPSVNLSGIVTEALKTYGIEYNEDVLSYAKIRASWAQVGKDTDPYQLQANYSVNKGHFNDIYGSYPNIEYNSNLKPEISTSAEIGTELKFFHNRIGVDFTYYNSKTKNQVLTIDLPQSSGYAQKYINAGQISNKGFEVMLNTTPIKTKDFSFDMGFNFASNVSKADKLDSNVKVYSFGQMNNGWEVVAYEGGKLGDILAKKFQRDSNGNILIDAAGVPLETEKTVVGNLQPDWTGSINLGANYKGFSLAALITIQQGGDILSSTEASAAAAGTAKRTQDRTPIVVKGVHADGSVNTTAISAQSYWNDISDNGEAFKYDASYMKLKELSFGYSFNSSQLKRLPFTKARISLIARNLFYFYKHTPGTAPDASSVNTHYYSQAFDFIPVPNTRTYGFSLNLGF